MPLEEKPKLFVLAIGIDQYASPNGLSFPVKDASSVANLIKNMKSEEYSEVRTFELLDNNATRENIQATFVKIGQEMVSGKDSVLLYFAGHGVSYDEKYYFIPHDVLSPDMISEKGFSQDMLGESIAKLNQPKNIFLILDTCYSGQFDIANVGMDRTTTLGNINKTIGDNVFFLSAASPLEKSADGFTIPGGGRAQNGIFAFTLLDVLKSDKGLINKKKDTNTEARAVIVKMEEDFVNNLEEHHLPPQTPSSRINTGGKFFITKIR